MLAVLAESALRSLLLGSAVSVGLRLFRVRDPHVHMTCWSLVLVASMAMPLLMHWTTVTVTWAPSVPVDIWAVPAQQPELLPSSIAPVHVISGAAHQANRQAFDWWALATAIYIGIAALLMLRLVIGLLLTWRLARKAVPV